MLDTACICSKCKIGKLQLKEDVERKMGLSSMLILECQFCQKVTESHTSPKCDIKCSQAFEINRRAILGMLEIGGGRKSLEKICAILNLPAPMAKEAYNDSLKALKDVIEMQATESMNNAAKLEHSLNKDDASTVTECNAMFDGTWRKRGHSSLQGAVTAISAKTGRCLDIKTLNKVCRACSVWASKPDDTRKEAWKASHQCSINYTGSAPAMEQEGVKRIFSRSESSRSLQYTGYIGDGDSKSYSSVVAMKPYGEKAIKKYECVGHVQKRMGSALRKLKSARGNTKLCDGKTLGGRGRLTAERIEKLQIYYGLAIRRNKGSVSRMKKEIWAGLEHTASTDEKPQHGNCPDHEGTWCKFKAAQRNGEKYIHKNSLPEAVVKEIKPIYERLTKQELLEGCLGGYTQNNCESLNHLIWARCPKSTSSGREALDCAAAGAVLAFNEGNSALCDIIKGLGITPGTHMSSALLKMDRVRISDSNIQASERHRKMRKAKRIKTKTREEKEVQAEGTTYEAGGF